MELFEKEVKRLNQDHKFTEFMSAEEEEEKLKKTLIEDARNDGEKIGLQKGKELGIQEGKELGIQEGETKKQIEIAKNMLENKMVPEMISKLTGLSKSEIEALK